MKSSLIIFAISALFLISFSGCYSSDFDPNCGCWEGDPGYGQGTDYGDQVGSYAPYGAYSSGPLAGYPSDQMDIGYYDNGMSSSSRASYNEHYDLKNACDYYGWQTIGINTTWEEKYDLDGYYVEGYYELSSYYTFGRQSNPESPRDTIWLAKKIITGSDTSWVKF